MEMKKVNGGTIRAIGYDDKRHALAVELSGGTFEYASVSSEMWRRFSTSASMQSFFRDQIDEVFSKRRIK
jgi:KTSC domain